MLLEGEIERSRWGAHGQVAKERGDVAAVEIETMAATMRLDK